MMRGGGGVAEDTKTKGHHLILTMYEVVYGAPNDSSGKLITFRDSNNFNKSKKKMS